MLVVVILAIAFYANFWICVRFFAFHDDITSVIITKLRL